MRAVPTRPFRAQSSASKSTGASGLQLAAGGKASEAGGFAERSLTRESYVNLKKPAEPEMSRSLTLQDGSRVTITVEPAAAISPSLVSDASAAFADAIEAAAKPNPKDEAGTQARHRRIIGESQPMRALQELLVKLRRSDASVLVLGENGTGKELVARQIHEESRRARKPFVAANCSAFNDNLLESELFGHKRGAFTGAVSDKQGLFTAADGGTFFLDEVGDMSPALQVKLLRVLQEGVFSPVGDTQPRQVDVRIIAATNRDLERMVREGRFREDLYYRLNVVTIQVPPLRDRPEDIPLLAEHFLAQMATRSGTHKRLDDAVVERLVEHDWPGNVRELENEIERLYVLSGDARLIDANMLKLAMGVGTTRRIRTGVSDEMLAACEGRTLPEATAILEEALIRRQLKKVRGNKTKAAEALGISRRNLIRKVQTYGLDETGSDSAS